MEIAIRPDDLHAAALALSTAAARLDDAALSFGRGVQPELPELGMNAAVAGARGMVASEHAVQVLGKDISRLAQALHHLAQHYPRVDATALPHR
jgi:hypothetical protein